MVIYNYVSAGLISYDEIILNSQNYKIFGGSVIYSSIQASLLGCHVGLISAIGEKDEDELLRLLKNYNVEIIKLGVYQGETLSFVNEYIGNDRMQKVKNHPKLTIKFNIEDFEAECFHLGPIINEFSFEEIEKARKISKYLALDIQGFCRTIESSLIKKRKIEDISFLKFIDILKCDLDELYCLSNNNDPKQIIEEILDEDCKILLLTLGDKGSVIISKHKTYYIPAHIPEKQVDPTGAGDVYLTSFLISYSRSHDLEYAGLFASSASSFVLEDIGYKGISNKQKIEERMRKQKLKAREIEFDEIPFYKWAGPDLNRGPSPRKGDILPG
jgi:sugar/nucleoside kinase (ribokinase family)